jgi:hypothetical protein
MKSPTWNMKPSLSQKNMAPSFGPGDSNTHLGAGIAKLDPPDREIEIEILSDRSPQKGPPRDMLRLGTKRLPLLNSGWILLASCDPPTTQSPVPRLPGEHTCHALQDLELLVTELVEVLHRKQVQPLLTCGLVTLHFQL